MMDWIQKTSMESWDRENRKKDSNDRSKMKLDPVSHLPAQSYQKQEPIYATADDPDSSISAPESDNSMKKQTPDAMANERLRMELRQRGATVSGSRMEHFPAPSHRQYPVPSWQNSGPQGRGGREFQGSTSQGDQGRGFQGSTGVGGQGSAVRGREFQGTTGQWAQGRKEREFQSSAAQWGQGYGGRGPQGSASQGSGGMRGLQGSTSQGTQGQGMPREFQAGPGVQGKGGRDFQGPAAQGRETQPTPYPTARFEKDYYVLDV